MIGSKSQRLVPNSWKNTLNLPKTSFPPRAPSVSDRVRYLQKCTDDLYAWQRSERNNQDAAQQTFTLHDGPPYANGDLHIGHALNKILKDITCRFQLSQGKLVNYTPGWDCHGLPIELKALAKWKLSESPNANEQSARDVDPLAVRGAARQLAAQTVEEQKKSFREWGIMADWDNAWKTMDKGFEIKQLEVFKRLVERGLVYRKFRPVFWSPSTQTALAEAELDYRDDHLSTAAFVKYELLGFPALRTLDGSNEDPVHAVIWTTTPWTLPANKAIGFHSDLEYVVVSSTHHGRLLLARSRLKELQKYCNDISEDFVAIAGSRLAGSTYQDPIFDGKSAPRPLLHANFVRADSGSGLVHLAPGHGKDDYELGLQHGLSASAPVDDRGRFTPLASLDQPGLLFGKEVLTTGNHEVLEMVSNHGHLLGKHSYVHKYPYDWRSKQPVIVRATEQWFANVGDIQDAALQALDAVNFVPEASRARLESFVRNRSEWCVSRQRAWGVPIPALYNTENPESVLTEDTIAHIITTIEERGIDAWWSDDELDPVWTPPGLRDSDGQTKFTRGKDTMDVWFDSGTSWTQTSTEDHVANMYLEGTDQHRGWFQSSLLTYVANRDLSTNSNSKSQAPFRSLVTHGFTLDQHGRKMSKSEGNVVSPNEIIDGKLSPLIKKRINGKMTEFRDAMGPDALRLWVASCDYTKDVIVGELVVKAINNALAKYRVTFKLLLGMLQDYKPPSEEMAEELMLGHIHKIAIWQLERLESSVRKHYQNLDYNKAVSEINKYITSDFSGFYFESVKDAAYCGTAQERLETQFTLNVIYDRLQCILAPVTPLLIQETWEHTPKHLQELHGCSPFQRVWSDLAEQRVGNGILGDSERTMFETDVPQLLAAFAAVQAAQEKARADKKMGSSLQSFAIIKPNVQGSSQLERFNSFFNRYEDDLGAMFVTSNVDIDHDVWPPSDVEWQYQSEFEFFGTKAVAHIFTPCLAKCIRCWRYAAPLEAKREDALCDRCASVLEDLQESRPEIFEEVNAAAAA